MIIACALKQIGEPGEEASHNGYTNSIITFRSLLKKLLIILVNTCTLQWNLGHLGPAILCPL